MTALAPGRYVELLQSPRTYFFDPELQQGTAKTDRLGLPMPFSGNFAVAFRMTCGSRVYAVRCFTRDVPELQRRYNAISRFCNSTHDPSLCGFEYQANGIKYNGNALPIVKMEWAGGERLDRWLARNRGDARALRRVAEALAHCSERLAKEGAAHGDLQHGNLIVEPAGFVRLIDYDGMFVPGLQGLESPLIGEPNYQHPGRVPAHFDATIDRFAVLVLFIGLNALAGDATRYDRYDSKEGVLFQRADFEQPDASALFHELAHDSTVGNWALALAEACRRPVTACPSLQAVLDGSYLAQVGPVTLQRRAAFVNTRSSAPSSAPSGPTPSQPRTVPSPPPHRPAPSWAQSQPSSTAPQPPYSPLPATYVIGTAPQPRPRGRALVLGAFAALVLSVLWHPWSHHDDVPKAHSPAYVPPRTVARSRQSHANRGTTNAPQPRATTMAQAKPTARAPRTHAAAARGTPGQRHVAAARHAEQIPVFNVPNRDTSSAASEVEDLAERGRAPSSATEGGKGAEGTTQACALADQDAATVSLVTPDAPASLEGRHVVAEVRVTLDAGGHVVAVAIERSSQNAEADAAALTAARSSVFRAARRNCSSVGGDYSVQFDFN